MLQHISIPPRFQLFLLHSLTKWQERALEMLENLRMKGTGKGTAPGNF